MAAAEVLALLGAPLTESTQQWSEVWSYWPPDANSNIASTTTAARTFSLFGKVSHLRFTEGGLVAKVSGDYLEVNATGWTKQQALGKLGEPNQRELKPYEAIYHYTTPGKSGTYKRREVHFDSSGKVSSILAVIYYD